MVEQWGFGRSQSGSNPAFTRSETSDKMADRQVPYDFISCVILISVLGPRAYKLLCGLVCVGYYLQNVGELAYCSSLTFRKLRKNYILANVCNC